MSILTANTSRSHLALQADKGREYLERVIISTKGSVERAKVRVDKMCTLRTTAPELFAKVNVKEQLPDSSQWYINVYMPKRTEDNYRVYVVQIKSPLELHPTTVEDVRKEFNLDKPGRMDEAIDILYEWIQKQVHFLKKDFCREYLERVIISSKGSLERSKLKLDKLCTLRTTAPQLFTKFNVKQEIPDLSSWSIHTYMPKLTEDNYRIQVLKVTIKTKITSSIVLDVYRAIMISCEYIKRNDYAKGIIIIMDLRDINIMELVSEMNFVDLNATAAMYTEGFGFRIKNIFIVSESKLVHLFSSLLKRVISAKLRERVIVLRTVEDIQDNLPKELLPKDYGGHQKCLRALHDEWTEEISSEDHVEFLKEITQACTDESLRVSDEFCNNHYGVPGTFKLLSID